MPAVPDFYVGDVPIYGDVILAPMAGYSDVPYRALCRAYGSAMNYTEFTPAEALLGDPNPMWRRLDVEPGGERPLTFQIFGRNAGHLLAAAQRIEAWGPDIIDVNMGCSVPQVSEQGSGAGMLRQPKLVAETFRLLSRHLSVPVTGKIRLGWDHTSKNYREIARIMEDNGAALIAVHGRTKMQHYGDQADWDAIAELKQTVSLPVIGNGDVQSPADIDRLRSYTGCDAVMVGRAAVGNPWIFARRERATLRFLDITAVIRRHLNEMLAYYGEPAGLIGFRRHLRRYLSGLALKRFMQPMLATEETAVFLHHLAVMETAVPADETLETLSQRTWFPRPQATSNRQQIIVNG